ncbi:hypothetical protein ACSSS7_002061 [Eimeria intestinalis]
MRGASGASLEACASGPSPPTPHEHLPRCCLSYVSMGAARAFPRQTNIISGWHQGSAAVYCVVSLLFLALIGLSASSLAFAFQANTPQTFSVSSPLRPARGVLTEAIVQPQGAPSCFFRASWVSRAAHAWGAPVASSRGPLDDVGPSFSHLGTGDFGVRPSEAGGTGSAQAVSLKVQKTSGHERVSYKTKQHLPPLAGGPSRVEVNSFFRFLETLAASKPQQQHQQQQPPQRALPLSAAVDAVLFLAGCAVSLQWTLRISRTPEPAPGPQAEGGPTPQQQQQQREGSWLLLCTPLEIAAPAEAVPLQAVASLFTSLHQLLPQKRRDGGWGAAAAGSCLLSLFLSELVLLHLTATHWCCCVAINRLPCSSITRLLPPLFLLGRSLGVSAADPSDAVQEVREAAAALLQLLQAGLQRAAAEAPLLAAGETVQRVTAVADALAGWSRRGPVGSTRSFVPLLSLGATETLTPDDRGGAPPWLGRPAREAPADVGAAALAAALQREGAPPLPHTLLHAAAEIMEASALAAAHGLGEVERLQQHHSQQQDIQSLGFSRKLHLQQQQHQQGSAARMLRKPADTVREVVAAIAAWLPVYYLIMRVNGGIWLPALQQLAESAAHKTTRLLELYLSHQQQQHLRQEQQPQQQQGEGRGMEGAAAEPHCSAWNAVGRLLYGEVQQLAACLARMHALKPLRGMRRLASAAVAFDRHLSSHLSAAAASPSRSADAPLAAAAAGVAGSFGTSTALPFRPLLHTRDPPKDLREAERRVRFFCSLVALGVGDSSISAGVAACLPSERQLLSLSPLDREGKQQTQRHKTRFRNHHAEAAATQCARNLPLQLLQRLLVCCSWIGDYALVLRGLAALKLRLETLTLQNLMRAHAASPLDCTGTSIRSASALRMTAATAAGSESNAAELVGKTLALLAKVASRASRELARGGEMQSGAPPRPAGTSLAGDAQQLPDKDLKERASGLNEALCDLASAATLWAAATGFEGQSPEDVALLTFSLIPFWLHQDPAAGAATCTHTAQHVAHIRAAAAAAATAAQQRQQQQGLLEQHEPQQGELTEHQLVDLARSLRGVTGFFAGRRAAGAPASRAVNPATVEFFLSELTERRGVELAGWPPPLLFLLAYNVLRLRLTRSPEARGGLPQAVPADGDASASAAAAARQQQLGKAVEAAAGHLLLRVVAAVEKGVTFPEPVNAWCKKLSLQAGKQRQHNKHQLPLIDEKLASSSPLSTKLSADEDSVNTTAAADDDDERRCNIRLVGLREVGSFLWALGRAEGGYSAALAGGGGSAEDAAAAYPEGGEGKAASSRSFSPSRLSTDVDGDAPLTLQEAARVAAQAVRRSGGLADKLALYCGAAIREANNRLLERCSPAAFLRPSSGSRGAQQSISSSAAAAVAGAAGGGLSAVLHAPLLAADCGLPQLFHLLRPLAASVRSELEASRKTDGEAPSVVSHGEALPASSYQRHIAQHHETQPSHWQQRPMGGSGSSSGSSSGCLRLLGEAQAFIFAVAVGLLQHAQAISTLPLDTPRTAAQVQLLFLASSDFALLLHAHCLPADRMQGAQRSLLRAERSQSTCVTASAGFRRVLQELLTLLSGLAVRHAKQICGLLSLLAAAAEIFSRCGRCVPLPPGSRQAMRAFAPAAIAALRQPASSHSWRNNSHGAFPFHPQKAGGAEEVKRLAAALEALKFVELK